MMDRSAVQIGDWYAPCCVHDLDRIQNEANLQDAREGVPFAGAWRTLKEALTDLLTMRHYMRREDLEEDIEYARERFGAECPL